jgi:hypothetical protein
MKEVNRIQFKKLIKILSDMPVENKKQPFRNANDSVGE